MLTGLEYKEARQILMEQVCPVETEAVPLAAADGRILAQAVIAAYDVPPFDRSPYDGYAFRAEDTVNASGKNPAVLQILEEVPAGSMWSIPVTPGTATKILTGAPIPPGADAVTKYEETEFNQEQVKIFTAFQPEENIIPRGEDVVKGMCLASPGMLIDSGLLGTLAAQGITRPLVYRRPRVGVISTGSELVEAGKVPTEGRIVNTNRYTFSAAIHRAGAEVINYGIVGDDPREIAKAFSQAAAECDLVISTGGVSVGDYDFTPAAIELAGAELLIRALKLKPGGASAYGRKGTRLLCGLSGNPASALINFYAVVLPALRKLAGHQRPELQELKVTLKDDFKKRSPKTRLIRGVLEFENGRTVMAVEKGQGNGVLHSLIGCNLLAEIPAGSPSLPAGTELKAYLIP